MLHNPLLRRAVLATWDVASWVLAALFVLVARYDLDVSNEQSMALVSYVLGCSAFSVAAGYATKMYRGRYRVASFDEALGVGGLALGTGFVALIVFVLLGDVLPPAIAFLSPIVALIGMLGGRWA